MAKKDPFIRRPKNAKETGALLGKATVGALERGAGALGAGFLSKGVVKDKVNPKIHGPILGIVGILGEAFIGEPHLNRVCQGIAVYGVQSIASQFVLKDKSANFGLGEVELDDLGEAEEEEDENLNGWNQQYGVNGTPSVFNDDPMPMNGMGEEDTSEVPEDFSGAADAADLLN